MLGSAAQPHPANVDTTGDRPLRSDRWTRLAPLSGVVFVILVLIGGLLLAGNTPDSAAGGGQVIAFYTVHRQRERAAAIVVALSYVAFLFFAGTLRARWRRQHGVEPLAALLLAAAGVVVVGQTTGAGVVYALSDTPARLNPQSAQTLNLLANDLVVTSAVGFLTFGIVAGLAILRGAPLPRWLGWAAIVIAILFVSPIEFVGFLLLLAWVLAVSVLTYRHHPNESNP